MNHIFELFNWKITRFLSIKWLRIAYFITIVLVILLAGVYEWYLGRQTEIHIALRLGGGIGIILGLMLLVLYVRIAIEFLISIFYIENHLRAIANRDEDFEIKG